MVKKKRLDETEEKPSNENIDLAALINDLRASDKEKKETSSALPMEEEKKAPAKEVREEKGRDKEVKDMRDKRDAREEPEGGSEDRGSERESGGDKDDDEEDEKVNPLETELLIERETLKKVGEELMSKKKQLTKLKEKLDEKWAEVKEKESAIKRATEILIKQKEEIQERMGRADEKERAISERLNNLDEKERKAAEFKDRTKEIDAREMNTRAYEDELKQRELRVKRLEEDMAKCARCSAKDNFRALDLMIQELKDFGIHDKEAEETLAQMRGDMDLGNNEAAFEKGESLLKRLKDRKEQEIAKGLIYMMVRAEGELKHAKEVAKTSVSLETPERWLTEARNLMEKQEYKSAEYYIREAEFALQAIARGVSVGDSGGQQAAAPAPVEGKTYACPSCSTSFTIDTPQRPVKVQCPGCHLELVIREDVTYA